MNLMRVGGPDREVQGRVSGLGDEVVDSYAWSSSATGVVTVTPRGDGLIAVLHPVAAGTSTITFTADPLDPVTMEVTVLDAAAPRASIVISSPTGSEVQP